VLLPATIPAASSRTALDVDIDIDIDIAAFALIGGRT
jgi:hypothetical protein